MLGLQTVLYTMLLRGSAGSIEGLVHVTWAFTRLGTDAFAVAYHWWFYSNCGLSIELSIRMTPTQKSLQTGKGFVLSSLPQEQ